MPNGAVRSVWIQSAFPEHLSSLTVIIRHSPARGMIMQGE
jgi:hypothetical protein